MAAPDLNFEIAGVEIPNFAAQPTLVFKLHITDSNEQRPVHSVMLRSQLRLAVTRRGYTPQEKKHLREVFGSPERWAETLHDQLWTHVSTVVPQFTSNCTVDLPVPCTYDFEILSTKYFDALEDGEIPLDFLFSGTIFYADEEGNLQVGQISWQKEAPYRLPVSIWRAMVQRYFPHSAWLRLRKDVFDYLYEYKITRGFPTWEELIVHLLEKNGEKTHL